MQPITVQFTPEQQAWRLAEAKARVVYFHKLEKAHPSWSDCRLWDTVHVREVKLEEAAQAAYFKANPTLLRSDKPLSELKGWERYHAVANWRIYKAVCWEGTPLPIWSRRAKKGGHA